MRCDDKRDGGKQRGEAHDHARGTAGYEVMQSLFKSHESGR